MRCPQCKSNNSRVMESRDVEDSGSIRRRRECDNCSHRFTTYERLELPRLLVIKKNGERELYNRDKLATGIYRACEKRPVDSERIEKLISEIERELYSFGETEITSGGIGELAMRDLAELDDVAYVRFASVYRRFTSIESFEKALQQIKRQRKSQ
jgi:transcriptional repressor NrdR